MGCDGCVTYLSLEHPPGEGVGPVHSREVPLPLTRDEIELADSIDFETLCPRSPLKKKPRRAHRTVGLANCRKLTKEETL